MKIPKAKCVRPCPYQYGACKKGWINVHPAQIKNERDLLQSEDSWYYCYEGKLLTVYTDVCEFCGERMEVNKQKSTPDMFVHECPGCKREIKMERL